jgi:hypothetical protein
MGGGGMNVDVEVPSLYERNGSMTPDRGRKRGACYQSDAIGEREEEECNETSSRHYRQQ